MPANVRTNPALLASAEILVGQCGLHWSEFTPDEQSCISRRISKCVSDGKPEDQAVAIAIRQCAPSKAMSDSAAQSAAAGGFGGKYLWSRNTDGTYNVYDVPVFLKHTRKLGMKLEADGDGVMKVTDNVVNVDEKWLSRAVEINRTRRETGNYIGPLHVHHHPRVQGEPDKSERAGHFLLKYVKPVEYEGESLPGLYADFIKVPAHIFEEIRKGLLPYRSVESLPPKYEEIDSIALLDTETPWFRLPLLTLGQEIKREIFSASAAEQVLQGYARAGQAWGALCYFAGEQFEEKKPKKDGEKDEGDEAKEKAAAGKKEDAEAGDAKDESGKNVTAGAEGQEVQADEEESKEISESEGSDVMPKILECLQAIAKQNEIILKHFADQAAPGTPPADAPVIEPKPALQASAAAAESLALKATVNKLQKERDVEKKVKVAFAGLASYNLAPDEEPKLVAVAMDSADPDKVIARFVETVTKYAQKMPSQDPLHGAAGDAPPEVKIPEGTPDEVRAYAAKGPKVLQRAIEVSAQYDNCREMGAIPAVMTRTEFLGYRVR
jgi:hypothetical protein